MKTRIGVIGADGGITPAVSGISEKIAGDIARSCSVLICGGRGGVMDSAKPEDAVRIALKLIK